MPVDVGKTLRQAILGLTSDRQRLDRQIDALQTALQALDGRVRTPKVGVPRAGSAAGVRTKKRRRMSGAARKAVGERMKAYWAKRKAEEPKGSSKKGSRRKRT